VTLGIRIVRELGLEDSVDTLGRWMSHYLAELIERAEQSDQGKEKETAKRECSDLIMKVWEKRKYWPHGQPLADLSKFLNSITPDPHTAHYNENAKQEFGWVEAVPRIRDLHWREDEVVLDAAVADLNLDRDREWLKEHPDELSEEERRTISWLLSRQEGMRASYYKVDDQEAPNFVDLSPEERAHLVFSALDKINSQRQEIVEKVKRANVIPQNKNQ
jgi:hypothetical protein